MHFTFNCSRKIRCFYTNISLQASSAGEQNSDIRVVQNEMSVEICKTKERLDILDFLGFRPGLNGLDFGRGHGKAIFGEDVSKVFNCISREAALVRMRV